MHTDAELVLDCRNATGESPIWHGAKQALATVARTRPGMRFNDGRCDRQGRFWAGIMVMNMSLASPAGALYSYDPSNGLKKMLDGFITPNGLAFSSDSRTMYLSDSHPSKQLALDGDQVG